MVSAAARLVLVLLAGLVVSCASAAVVPAQAQVPPAPPSTTLAPAPETSPAPPAASGARLLAEYRVGSGDVLQITVFGNEDLSRVATVQNNGTISYPLLGEVAVDGLTLDEIKQKLTKLLSDTYLVNPQVEVGVKDYESQFVSVLGEVNAPGRKPLRGRTRLIDVLVESGGFTSRASNQIVITRREGFDGGGTTLRLNLGNGTLSAADQVTLELPLKNGDIITVLPKHFVTVEGEVVRPGRYAIEGDLTVTGAISTAGGLTRFGGNKVGLRRRGGSADAPSQILRVDLNAIRNGKQPDVVLMPDDVITVPRRIF